MPNDNFYTWPTGDSIQFTKHFNSQEFECVHDNPSGENRISKDLVDRLELLREKLGLRLTITSGFRTPEHNKLVGGVPHSQHLLGMASDLRCDDMDKLYELCLTIFNAVGDGRKKAHFIHVDVRELPKNQKAPLTFGYAI